MCETRLVCEARRRAERYIEIVSYYMRAYDCGSALDPLFKWSLAKTPNPRDFIVLQDWYLEEPEGDDSGTVDENTEYTEECFNHDPGEEQPTFSALFHTPWSKTLIEKGSYLILNAAWGLRKLSAFKDSVGTLPNKVHIPALGLWLWLATEIKPQHIYLAGAWARNGKEFGHGHARVLSVKEYFDCWPKEAQKQEIVWKARAALSQTKFHSLPHPSYYLWKQKTTL
jgi:hypothetical protein